MGRQILVEIRLLAELLACLYKGNYTDAVKELQGLSEVELKQYLSEHDIHSLIFGLEITKLAINLYKWSKSVGRYERIPGIQVTGDQYMLRLKPTIGVSFAEFLYIFRPTIYMFLVLRYHKNSKIAFIASLIVEICSYFLYKSKLKNPDENENSQISQRKAQLFKYLLRDPLFRVAILPFLNMVIRVSPSFIGKLVEVVIFYQEMITYTI